MKHPKAWLVSDHFYILLCFIMSAGQKIIDVQCSTDFIKTARKNVFV